MRLGVWGGLLLLLLGFLYVNQIGLPGFLKDPLLKELRAEGINLEFSRLRFRLIEGVVAENVRFGRSNKPSSPVLTSKEVRVKLNNRALVKSRVQVDSLYLRDGNLLIPVLDDKKDTARREIAITNINAYVRLLPNNQWALDNFRANFAGVHFQVTGILTNAVKLRDWPFVKGEPEKSGSPKDLGSGLSTFADALDTIHFATPPDLRLEFSGDAEDFRTFHVRLLLLASNATTGWGDLEEGRLEAKIFAADTNGLSRGEVNLKAASAHTQWATVTNFALNLSLASLITNSNIVAGSLNATSEAARTRWGESDHVQINAEWAHSLTNPIPLSGKATLIGRRPVTPWASAGQFALDATFFQSSEFEHQRADRGLAVWGKLRPFEVEWQSRISQLQSPDLDTDDLTFSGSWHFPNLVLSNLQSRLYQGQLQATANLDVVSRRLEARLASEVNPHKLMPVLPVAARKWLQQFTWEAAPSVQGMASVKLPSWTNQHPDWKADVLPTLSLQGSFNIRSNASYRMVPVSAASSHFSYTNTTWHLPDLVLVRPEGNVFAEHRANDITREFYWNVRSSIQPGIVRHLLDEKTRRAFDLVQFSSSPVVWAELRGISGKPHSIGLNAVIAVTNFAFRGESVSAVTAGMSYTNKLLQVLNPLILRSNEVARADGLMANFEEEKIFLTNGISNTDPMFIARMIGRQVVKAIEPYRFEKPPRAKVSGTIPLKGEAGADLTFQLEGNHFSWWKFHLPKIRGQIHWQGHRVTLRDIEADFYEGQATGYATFDFPEGKKGADFNFGATITNALLQFVMSDLFTSTNNLEGRLSGSLAVTHANTEDWQSVQGYGAASLTDGLIWDIPLFGVFSPVLNGVSPGLGNSRATSAACDFTITNGVVHSPNLEMRSPQMRLRYTGNVDLEGKLDAKVEAGLFRDVWVVGPLVSTVFWPVSKLFEYRVTGMLDQPKSEPVTVVPKLMKLPLRPLKTLKGLLPADPPQSTTLP